MDADGTKAGFDLELIRLVRAAVDVPLIASGGAGAVDHFAPAVEAGADAVLAASVFHFGQLRIGEVKDALRGERGVRGPVTTASSTPRWTRRSPPGSSATPTAWSARSPSSSGTGEVLMVAWMDDEALHRTLTTRRATYFSRSRSSSG